MLSFLLTYGSTELYIYFWLICMVLFVLLELMTPGLFFCLSFSCGSLMAFLAAFLNTSLPVQVMIFFVGSFISSYILYYMLPLFHKYRPHEYTNVYNLKGKRGFVIKTITKNMSGSVKINGQQWSARSLHGTAIEQGSYIEVVDIVGVHLIVRKCDL